MYITRKQRLDKKRTKSQFRIKNYLRNSLIAFTIITFCVLAAPSYILALTAPLNISTVFGQPQDPSQVALPTVRVGNVTVFITGFVTKPGVHKVSAESRIVDAINAAGGISPGADVSKLNLAQYTEDAMHINVPGRVPGPLPKTRP
jgi:hypothetical protein